jgi:hypothetical protein
MIIGICLAVAVPAVALAQEEPTAPDEPAPAPEVESEPPPAAAVSGDTEEEELDPDRARWGVGARVRYVTIPNWLLELFLDHATHLSSYSVAGEIIRRKGDLDIVISIDWTSGAAENGLYLEKGDNPNIAPPDYTEFDGFGMLSADVSFVWHARVHERVQIRYGGGIGVGLLLGEIYQTDTLCPGGTTADDLDDPNHCTQFTATRHVDEDVPPALPVVNVLLGARIKLADQMSMNLEGGFRNAFFFGLGFGYFF